MYECTDDKLFDYNITTGVLNACDERVRMYTATTAVEGNVVAKMIRYQMC